MSEVSGIESFYGYPKFYLGTASAPKSGRPHAACYARPPLPSLVLTWPADAIRNDAVAALRCYTLSMLHPTKPGSENSELLYGIPYDCFGPSETFPCTISGYSLKL